MSRRMAFLHLPPIRWLTSFYNPPVLPNLTAQRKSAKRIHRDAMVSVVQTQVDEYANDGGNENVSLEELRDARYLTAAQVKKAHEQHIVIVDGKVIKR